MMNIDIDFCFDFKFITQIYGYLLYLPNWKLEYRYSGCDEAINLSGIKLLANEDRRRAVWCRRRSDGGNGMGSDYLRSWQKTNPTDHGSRNFELRSSAR